MVTATMDKLMWYKALCWQLLILTYCPRDLLPNSVDQTKFKLPFQATAWQPFGILRFATPDYECITFIQNGLSGRTSADFRQIRTPILGTYRYTYSIPQGRNRSKNDAVDMKFKFSHLIYSRKKKKLKMNLELKSSLKAISKAKIYLKMGCFLNIPSNSENSGIYIEPKSRRG